MTSKMDEIRFFRQVTGKKPFGDYQTDPARFLRQGRNIILRMPTGSGKSEALLCAYLWSLYQNPDFPQQMVYGLPMRNLVDSLGQRFAGYQKNFDQLSVAIQHGADPGTPSFYSDLAIATIDQIISAYACAPLGYPVRHGSIPAGAIASAFLTFDEIHTFDPERALQSALFIVEHSCKLEIPFAFLSATLPDSFIAAMEKQFNAKIIDVDEDDIPVRRAREVSLENWTTRPLTPEQIRSAWSETETSLLVVCNTVRRAQELWAQVRGDLKDVDVVLLHSRFTPQDRGEKETSLEQLLGKNGIGRGIVITTQVVEVGLDVSSDLLLTEIAPVDALIQRAGRVARWGGTGRIRIFNVEHPAPYLKDLIEATQSVLPTRERHLNWEVEKELVNKVLDKPFLGYLTPESRGRAIHWLGEGAFTGNRASVAKAIRNIQSCTVTIHDHPEALRRDIWRLPQIRLNAWTLLQHAKSNGVKGVKKVVVDHPIKGITDQESLLDFMPIRIPEEIRPNDFFVLSSLTARYEPAGRGLVLGVSGEPMSLLPKSSNTVNSHSSLTRETWQEHCHKVLWVFYENFLPCYEGVLKKLSEWWGLSYNVFLDRVAFCVGLHDLGKLNQEWQRIIGRQPGEPPIAHSGEGSAKGKLPPHATVSAYLLQDQLIGQWGRRFSGPLLCAIAHHHSVRAAQVPRYHLISEWEREVQSLFSAFPGLAGIWDEGQVKDFAKQTTPAELNIRMPVLEDGRSWRTYAVIARLLKLSDRMATAGSEYVLLRDEDWLTDV